MKYIARLTLLFIILLQAGVFNLAQATTPENSHAQNQNSSPLILGIFPRRNATNTMKMFAPLADYLTKQLGRKVMLETTRDFGTFWNHVQQQRYDIVHFNQYHYIKSHESNHYQVIAQNEEFGRTTISGAILVRKDSGINTLADLKNKTILFGGGKKAMIAYIATTSMLRRAGLNEGDYKEAFAKNPPNSLLSVYYKQADAAGAGDIVTQLSTISRLIDVSKIKTLAISDPLAHIPWAVKTELPDNVKNKIQQSLLMLNDSAEGKRILKSARLTGLHIAKDSDYDIHRSLIKDVFK